MGFQDFLIDAKNIILGKADEESAVDFKLEIEKAVKSGIITKAEATEIIQTYNNQKKEGKDFDKKQISTISLEDGSVVSEEDAKKKKEELERKKREKENQKLANENANRINKTSIKEKTTTKSGRLTIDRNKLQNVIQNDEKQDNKNNVKTREEEN